MSPIGRFCSLIPGFGVKLSAINPCRDYTPKHGSWLNLAKSELGVLTSQCLDCRIPNKQILIDEIAAWEHDRNANHTKADWQFATKNARIKLKHLYPAI
jgi:hypothetical protein